MRASERKWKGQKSDTGWVAISSTVTGTWGIKYRVVNGIMTVMLSGTVSVASGSTVTFATGAIPANLCPPVVARGGGAFNGISGTVAVTAAGDVTGRQDSGSTQPSVTGTINYPVT